MKKLIYFTLSEQGLRDNNEDFCHIELLADGKTLLAIIADGVGGENAGEVASMVTCKVMSDYLAQLSKVGLDELRTAMIAANNRIMELQKNPEYANMATVASACLICPNENIIHICHVGDTRIYSLNANKSITKMTKDHSYVGRLFDEGLITEKQAMSHPHRNRISKCIGSMPLGYFSDYFYTGSFPLTDIKRIILCSDGLYDTVSSDEIRRVLAYESCLKSAANVLVELALAKGSCDNISVIVVDVLLK